MKFIKLGLVAAALMTVSGVSLAQQKDIKIVDPRESPYVISPNGVVVMNPFGLCWRTGFWSLERARTAKVEGGHFRVRLCVRQGTNAESPRYANRLRHRRRRHHRRRHRRHQRRLLRPARR